MDEKKTEDFKISLKERRFVEALASGESRKCALISAGFKVAHLEVKKIHWRASNILAKSKVKSYLRFLNHKAMDEAIMSKKEILANLSHIARFNFKDIATWDKNNFVFKDSKEITQENGHAIHSIKSTKDGVTLTSLDKTKALSRLLDYYHDCEKNSHSYNEDKEREVTEELKRRVFAAFNERISREKENEDEDRREVP